MPLPTGLRQRNGVWQLRIGVPADLAHLYNGPDAYRGSLRTRVQADAITKAHELIAQHRKSFDQQRASEAIRRAPPTVPLTPELVSYLESRTGWLTLLFDDFVRFTPGTVERLTPGIRFLTADQQTPLLTGDDPAKWNRLQALFLDQAKAEIAAGQLDSAQKASEVELRSLGVCVDWSEPNARMALVRIARAQLRAYTKAVERGQGEPHETPAPLAVPASLSIVVNPEAPKPSGHSFSDVFAEWQIGKKKDAIEKTKRALAKVMAAGINAPVEDLTRQDGFKLRDHINTTMTHAKGKTRSDVLAAVCWIPLRSDPGFPSNIDPPCCVN